MIDKMTPFRRKKSGKSFPVKVCTLDAELEFNLEVCKLSFLSIFNLVRTLRRRYYSNPNIPNKYLDSDTFFIHLTFFLCSGEQLGEISLN